MKHSRVYHFVWLLTFENEWIHYLPIEDELFTQLEGIMWWSSILYHKFIAPNSNRWPNNWWSNSFHETTLWVLPRGTIRDGLSLFIQKYCYIAPCMDYLPTFIQQNDTNVGDSTLRVSRPILEGWWYPQDLQRHSTPFWIWLNFHSPSHSPPKKIMVKAWQKHLKKWPALRNPHWQKPCFRHTSHNGWVTPCRGAAMKPRHPKNEFTTSRLESNRGT